MRFLRFLLLDGDSCPNSTQQLEQTITPIGRQLEPDEIAPSDQAAAVTGQAYNIRGGILMAC